MTTLREFVLAHTDVKDALTPFIDQAVLEGGDDNWNATANKFNELVAPTTTEQSKVVERRITALGIMSALGVERGAAVLDALETAAQSSSPIKWAMTFLLGDQGINLGDIETRRMLDELATNNVLQLVDVNALKALAEVHETVTSAPAFAGYPVDQLTVREAVFLDNGTRVF